MEEERHKKTTKTSELSSAVWDIINSSSYLYTLDFAFTFPLVVTESNSKQTSTIHPNYVFLILSGTVHTEDIRVNFIFCTTDYFVDITSFRDDGYLKNFVCFYQFLLNWVQEFLLVCTYVLRVAFHASCRFECVFEVVCFMTLKFSYMLIYPVFGRTVTSGRFGSRQAWDVVKWFCSGTHVLPQLLPYTWFFWNFKF